VSSLLYDPRAAAIGAWWIWQNQGPHASISHPTIYNVAKAEYPPTAPTFMQLTGSVSRVGLRADAGNAIIGEKFYEIVFYWRKLTHAPSGNLSIGIRKASDDSFVFVAQHPIPIEQQTSTVAKALVTGASTYNPVLNDVISIEGTGVVIMMNPTVANPNSNFNSRSFNGSVWSSVANAIAGTVKAEVST
jgi:hypothetical protein